MKSEQLRKPRMRDGGRLEPSLEVVDAVGANRLPASLGGFCASPLKPFRPAPQGDGNVGTVFRRGTVGCREPFGVVFFRLRICSFVGRQLPQRKVGGNKS